MSRAYSVVKLAIQTLIDLGTDVLDKIALGTPGTSLQYPTTTGGKPKQVFSVGGIWAGASGNPWIPILQALCGQLDRDYCTWTDIATEAAGIAPTIWATSGVSGVTKDEINNELTFTFTTAYLNVNYFVSSKVYSTPTMEVISGQGTGSVTVQFRDHANAIVGINKINVTLFTCGIV